MKDYNRIPPKGMPERIRKCVYESDKTVIDICKELRINRSRLYDYMNGVTPPNATIVVRMCEVFNVAAGWLLTGE